MTPGLGPLGLVFYSSDLAYSSAWNAKANPCSPSAENPRGLTLSWSLNLALNRLQSRSAEGQMETLCTKGGGAQGHGCEGPMVREPEGARELPNAGSSGFVQEASTLPHPYGA